MYITNYNLNRVLKSTSIESLEEIDISDLQDILSEKEILFLKQANTFFKDKGLSEKKFIPINFNDTHTMLFEKHKPAYHKNKECIRLHADYVNYYIPNEVRERGDTEVDRFRKFVKGLLNKGYKLEDEGTIIAIKAEFQFSDKNFGKIEENNSGKMDFMHALDSMNLLEIHAQIAQIIHKLNMFSSQSEIYRQVYRLRYREPYMIRKLMKNKSKEQKNIAEELKLLKENLLLSLIASYKKENNFNQSDIEEELLQELNFVPCSTCCK